MRERWFSGVTVLALFLAAAGMYGQALQHRLQVQTALAEAEALPKAQVSWASLAKQVEASYPGVKAVPEQNGKAMTLTAAPEAFHLWRSAALSLETLAGRPLMVRQIHIDTMEIGQNEGGSARSHAERSEGVAGPNRSSGGQSHPVSLTVMLPTASHAGK